ncbi:MAG: hypothetical protein R3B45_08360 [Bdellovibrionota bacterium]
MHKKERKTYRFVQRTLLILLFFSAMKSFALDFNLFGGQQKIKSNTLFTSQEGVGFQYIARGHFSIDKSDTIGIDLGIGASLYRLNYESIDSDVTINSKGTFYSEFFEPTLIVATPSYFFRLYAGFSYIFANYYYRMDKNILQSSDAASIIESQVTSVLDLKSNGLRAIVGIRIGGQLFGMVEISDSYETLEIKKAKISSSNKINGEKEAEDVYDSAYENSSRELIGRKFNFSTRSILIGVGYNLY